MNISASNTPTKRYTAYTLRYTILPIVLLADCTLALNGQD